MTIFFIVSRVSQLVVLYEVGRQPTPTTSIPNIVWFSWAKTISDAFSGEKSILYYHKLPNSQATGYLAQKLANYRRKLRQTGTIPTSSRRPTKTHSCTELHCQSPEKRRRPSTELMEPRPVPEDVSSIYELLHAYY